MADCKDDLCLKWSEFESNLTKTFDQLRRSQDFVDVTLSVGGNSIKCHKVVLCASSPYFAELLSGTGPGDHPVIILNDVSFPVVSLIVDFIYTGSINIPSSMLDMVNSTAEVLNIRGITNKQSKQTSSPASEMCGSCNVTSQPAKKRRLFTEADGDMQDRGEHSQPRTVIQCSSNGNMSRLQVASTPSSKPSASMSTSRLASTSLRGSSSGAGGSGDLDNYSDIRPDILEMIKEEQKAKMMEPNQNWSNSSASSVPGSPYCYQNQIQNMWQKCWNQSASSFQGLRYRERGPMKSWRSETMAEAIWSVLQEGLSLSQAARKHDIPYPTFVLYANRVHNMLGPSPLNGYGVGDLRPKGRGRPQRILLGQWPEDHVREVIRAVVFREGDMGANTSSPPAPTSSPSIAKTEPQEPSQEHHGHPHGVESRAAQAAFEAQMKQFYNNSFATQLLAASSKMFSNIELNPFLQTRVKMETPDEETFEDADNERTDNMEDQNRNSPVDLVTNSNKSIDAIASKLGNNVEQDQRPGGDNASVYNCSEEIRKKMKSVSDNDPSVALISATQRKSV